MGSDINYFLLINLIIIVILSIVYSNKKRKALQYLKSLESNYPKRMRITGKVQFSKIHILYNINLNIVYSENDLLIYGFDYYTTRRIHFIFHTNKQLKKHKENRILYYLIAKIDVEKNDKILIASENNYKITLFFKSYGKEKKQLKEDSFIELIHKLNKNYQSQ